MVLCEGCFDNSPQYDSPSSDTGAIHRISPVRTRSLTTSHPRSLLSMAMSKRARSRRRRCSSKKNRMAHMSRGRRGRFGPTFFPAFHGRRSWTAGSRSECPMVILLRPKVVAWREGHGSRLVADGTAGLGLSGQSGHDNKAAIGPRVLKCQHCEPVPRVQSPMNAATHYTRSNRLPVQDHAARHYYDCLYGARTVGINAPSSPRNLEGNAVWLSVVDAWDPI